MRKQPYPDDFSSSIDFLNQHVSVLLADCAAVSRGDMAHADFFEIVSAATDAVTRARERLAAFKQEEKT